MTCDVDYYVDSNFACIACAGAIPDCLDCSAVDVCTTCAAGKYPASNGGATCGECPNLASCATCATENTCGTCADTYYPDGAGAC